MSFGRRLSGIVLQAGAVLWLVSPALPIATAPGEVYRGQSTITIVGRAGSFGEEQASLPSGQRLGRLEVPEWSFPSARKPGAAVLARDGSLLMPAVNHNDSLTVATSPEMAVVAYDPRTNTSEVIQLASTPGVVNAKGMLVAPTVTALVPLPDGAVAFSAWAEGTDLAPVFGLLTKVDDHWQLRQDNRWTARALNNLGRVRGLVRLPASGQLIVLQEGGALTPLRVGGPDISGRYTVMVGETFHHPAGTDVVMREAHADPTSQHGAERFVVALDRPGFLPAIQEFRYDEAARTIAVLSAPLVPGDANKEDLDEHKVPRPYWYHTAVYDRTGKLWAARREGIWGGKLAVFTRDRCQPDAGGWARICPPDYDIIQAAKLPAPQALVEDTVGGTMVLMAADGMLMPVRANASGASAGPLGFEIGNLVDVATKLLTNGENSSVQSRPGTVDRDGHLWFPAGRANHGTDGQTTSTDYWMFAVNLAELFDPPPTRLERVPARNAILQAENTATISTRQTRTAQGVIEVHADAHFAVCGDITTTGCGYDPVYGNGFYLLDETGYGHLRGSLSYRVDVPVAGNYRLAYQVVTFAATTGARIEMVTGRRTYLTPVATNGDWRPMRSDVVVWFDAGVQTITIAPPDDRSGGWALNSMTLQRV